MKHLSLLIASVLLASVALLGVSLLGAEPSEAANGVRVNKCGGGKVTLSRDEGYLFNRHNQARASAKLGPLCLNPKLQQAADAHNEAMIASRKFSHNDKYGNIERRLKRFDPGLQAYGENIAYNGSYGGPNPDVVFSQWMKSKFHQPNINGANAKKFGYREVGISVLEDTRNGARYTVASDVGSGTFNAPIFLYTVNFGK